MLRKISISAAALLAGLSAPAIAQDMPKTLDEVVQVELLPGWRLDDGTHMAALRFDLAEGWKTYWRSPGDGGLPTHLDHGESGNVEELNIIWPHPEVFRTRGLRSIGYLDEVVLPLHLAPQSGKDIDLDLSLTFGICDQVCIPVHMAFQDVLTDQVTTPDAIIQAAIASRADQATGSATCDLSVNEDGLDAVVSMHVPSMGGNDQHVVIETVYPDAWVSEPTVTRDGDYLIAESVLVPENKSLFDVEPGDLQVTVISSETSVSYVGCATN